MRHMKDFTTSSTQDKAGLPADDTTEADLAPGTIDIPSQILPGFGESPLPVWLTERLNRLFRRHTPAQH
jgi:hypothetical protein